jgi:hypothetical protein
LGYVYIRNTIPLPFSIALMLKYDIRNTNRKLWFFFSFIIPKKLSAKYINSVAFSKKINSFRKKKISCFYYEKTGEKIA